jgi:predicted nucleic acid-binding Zn ribbon protein
MCYNSLVSKKSQKPVDAASVLQGLFENSKSPLAPGFQRWKLESQWPQVVGPEIAKHSRPVNYYNKILTVEVTNSVWLHELRYRIDEIKIKVNHSVGEHWVNVVRLIHK